MSGTCPPPRIRGDANFEASHARRSPRHTPRDHAILGKSAKKLGKEILRALVPKSRWEAGTYESHSARTGDRVPHLRRPAHGRDHPAPKSHVRPHRGAGAPFLRGAGHLGGGQPLSLL